MALMALINGSRPFMLFIENQNPPIAKEELNLMMLCFFSKNYIQVSGSPVIAFYGEKQETQDGELGSFAEYLSGKLGMQGWPGIRFWDFQDESLDDQLQKKSTLPLLLNRIDFDSSFLLSNFFTDFSKLDNYIVFRQPSVQEAVKMESSFHSMCYSLLQTQPLLKAELESYLLSSRAADDLNKKNLILKERLSNAEKTIGVILTKYKDDYEQLFTWYHNEYEILPLWYKRFGHILKVLMGKRTFKSLFHDHVKKYKV